MSLIHEAKNNGLDVEFGTDVLQFWNFEYDPISPSPLTFKNQLHYNFLVKTRTINSLKDIRRQFLRDADSRILLVLGNRGTGKTTAMKYLSSLIQKENEDVAFIDCPIKADENDFVRTVHLSILKGMRNFLLREKRLNPSEVNQVSNITGRQETSEIEDQIELLFDTICSTYSKRMLFFDNLDKAAPNAYEMVHSYFRSQQTFYDSFLNYDNVYLFISLQPLFKDFLTDPEVNFLAGKVIKVRPWTESELDELISNRGKTAFRNKDEYGKSLFRLDNFLTYNARRLIYANNDYNPRWSLLAVKKLLRRYYEVYSNKKRRASKKLPREDDLPSEIVDITKSPIVNEHFCRLYYREMEGVKRGLLPASKINFETLDVQARNRFKNAYDKTRSALEQFRDYRFDVVETMIAVYGAEDNLDDQSSLDKLSETGLIQIAQGKYAFTPDVLKFFDFLDSNVQKNSSYLRHYLLQYLI